MRCKKHLSDQSSGVGVCASCLRERLFALIAAQSQAHQAHSHQAQFSLAAEPPPPQHRRHHQQPPPLSFPRSVSPYVSRRKSDAAAAATNTWTHHDHHQNPRHSHLRFYSTPQVGPSFYDSATSAADPSLSYAKKKRGKLSSFLKSMFRARSDKSDPHHHRNHRVSCRDSYVSSSPSPSWFSAIFTTASRGGKSEDAVPSRRNRTTRTTTADRGMSPDFDYVYDDDGDRSPSGNGESAGSSPTWKRTPALAPSSARRSKPGQGRNVAGIAFCLSPLVRASPNRHWMNQKGISPEIGKASDACRVPTKPQLSNAASFCKNRSRKLADFGRANPNR